MADNKYWRGTSALHLCGKGEILKFSCHIARVIASIVARGWTGTTHFSKNKKKQSMEK
jgi:hypothetical protein